MILVQIELVIDCADREVRRQLELTVGVPGFRIARRPRRRRQRREKSRDGSLMPLAILTTLAGLGRSFSEICDVLETDARHAVSFHLARLREAGLVEPGDGPSAPVYEVTEEGRRFAELLQALTQ